MRFRIRRACTAWCARRCASPRCRDSCHSRRWLRSCPTRGRPGSWGPPCSRPTFFAPLPAALAETIETDLVPVEDARAWLVQARRAGEWLAAWDGLADEPDQVDLSMLLADAFGDQASAWPDRPEQALTLSLATVPAPEDGGLDVPYLSTLVARSLRRDDVPSGRTASTTDGPIATAARGVADERAHWHERYRALIALRQSLSDSAQRWITAPKDESDYRYESWIYGRSVGMAVLGTGATVKAKAAVKRHPDCGARGRHHVHCAGDSARSSFVRAPAPRAERSPPSLSRRRASAWLSLLEGLRRLGIAELPPPPDVLPHGPTHTAGSGPASRARAASGLRPAHLAGSPGASLRRLRRDASRGRSGASGGNAQRGRASGEALRPFGLRGPAQRRPFRARIGNRGARRDRGPGTRHARRRSRAIRCSRSAPGSR